LVIKKISKDPKEPGSIPSRANLKNERMANLPDKERISSLRMYVTSAVPVDYLSTNTLSLREVF
jgi:hypothetical protein